MADGQQEFALLCPHCGEENPPEFPACWSCHGALPALPGPAEARTSDAAPTDGTSSDPAKRRRRRQRIALELVAALLFLWLPSQVGWLWYGEKMAGETAVDSDVIAELSWIVTSLGALALLFYFGWLDGDWRRFYGLELRAPGRELLWTAGVWLAMKLADTLALVIAARLGIEEEPFPNMGYEPAALWIAPAGIVLAALTEEAFFRAYLWTRLTELTGRPWLAIAIASALFSVGHVYPPIPSLAVFLSGVLLTWIFWYRRSLWPLVLGHSIYNLTVTYG